MLQITVFNLLLTEIKNEIFEILKQFFFYNLNVSLFGTPQYFYILDVHTSNNIVCFYLRVPMGDAPAMSIDKLIVIIKIAMYKTLN